MNDCDKCRTPVPPGNDATLFEALVTGNPYFALANSRHLLPVVKDGVQVCEGSPSRAQYLEGQPRDSRGTYPYIEEREQLFRAAYQALLAEHGDDVYVITEEDLAEALRRAKLEFEKAAADVRPAD
jgi:hypothetical protein